MPRTFDGRRVRGKHLARVGPRIVLALPLGIGKPNLLVKNFTAALADPAIVEDFHALICAPRGMATSTAVPAALGGAFVGNDVPLEYVRDLHENAVPEMSKSSSSF